MGVCRNVYQSLAHVWREREEALSSKQTRAECLFVFHVLLPWECRVFLSMFLEFCLRICSDWFLRALLECVVTLAWYRTLSAVRSFSRSSLLLCQMLCTCETQASWPWTNLHRILSFLISHGLIIELFNSFVIFTVRFSASFIARCFWKRLDCLLVVNIYQSTKIHILTSWDHERRHVFPTRCGAKCSTIFILFSILFCYVRAGVWNDSGALLVAICGSFSLRLFPVGEWKSTCARKWTSARLRSFR